MPLIPWSKSVVIPNASEYSRLSIFINGKYESTLEIGKSPNIYRVVSLVASERPVGCGIVPEDMAVLAIYKDVFGPSSLEECKSWVEKNCTSTMYERDNKLSSLIRQASQIPDIDSATSKKGSKLKDR